MSSLFNTYLNVQIMYIGYQFTYVSYELLMNMIFVWVESFATLQIDYWKFLRQFNVLEYPRRFKMRNVG